MGRKPKSVPRYLKHARGTGYSRYRGKNFYFGKWGTDESRERYRRFLQQIEVRDEIEAKELVTPDARTVVTVLAHYLIYAKGYYVTPSGKNSAEYTSVKVTIQYTDAVMGDELAYKVGPAMLIKLQQFLIAKGHCRSHINKTISRVKRIFKWAASRELCPPETFHRLTCVMPLLKGRTTAREKPKVGIVPVAVVQATLPYLSDVVAAMVRMQVYCAMRPSEVCVMRSCDIDTTGEVWLYRPHQHKNAWREEDRVVGIPPAAQAILKPFMDREPEAYLFSPRDSEKARNDERALKSTPKRKTKVYPCELRARAAARLRRRATSLTRLHERYDRDSYRRAITYARAKAKRQGTEIPSWFPYQLRHLAITLLAGFMGQEGAQIIAGHKELETTSIYTHRNVVQVIEATKRSGQYWADQPVSIPVVQLPPAGGNASKAS